VGIGTSIFLIAIGAILDFALKVQSSAVSLKTVGLILMVVGAIGLVLSLIFWGSWGGVGSYRRTSRVRSAVPQTDAYGRVLDPRATEYVEEERRY
jgi:sulfite exporter TauE/SafE